MKSAGDLYRIINALSLDVATGAVICALFFVRLFHAHVLPQGLAALGIAVWIVYTADHLLDARRLTSAASTFRHAFHQQHSRLLIFLLGVACGIEFILLFFLRKPVFYNGLWLGVGVVLYVLINQWLKYFKEFTIALLYCGGVLLPALSLKESNLQQLDIYFILQFLIIVITNLILFSWMDYENDLKDHHRSLVTLIGKEKVKRILWILFVLFSILIPFTFSIEIIPVLILFAMQLTLFLIFLFAEYFKMNERFRYVGDAIFFLPVIILFV